MEVEVSTFNLFQVESSHKKSIICSQKQLLEASAVNMRKKKTKTVERQRKALVRSFKSCIVYIFMYEKNKQTSTSFICNMISAKKTNFTNIQQRL